MSNKLFFVTKCIGISSYILQEEVVNIVVKDFGFFKIEAMMATWLTKLAYQCRTVYTTSRFMNSLNLKLKTRNDIIKYPYEDVKIANSTLPEHIWKNLGKWADKTAIICGETSRSYTYHQIYKLSRNFAANLRNKFHITDGDAVQVLLHNCPEYAIIILGVLQANAILSPVHPTSTAYEITHKLQLSNPKLVIGSPSTIPSIKEGLRLTGKNIPVINLDIDKKNPLEGTISYENLIQDTDLKVLSRLKRNIDDVSVLPFSSGTTGLSKGVELTARSMVTNYIQQDIEDIKQYNDTTANHQESILAVLPFAHIYGLSIILLHKLSVGAKIVTLPKFHPRTFIDTLEKHRISLLYAAPPIVLFLSSSFEIKKNHMDSINKIVNGAASVPIVDVEKLMSKTKGGTQFMQVYGSTESALVTSTAPGSKDYRSCGYPLPNTYLKVIDPDGENLGLNEVGELLIKGPQIMKGYKNNHAATEGSFTHDGWYKSGDVAKIDQDGAIQIVDRIKELIKVKGFQVSPFELENVLKEHPAVLDAGVVGVPDRRCGEVPKAFIVLKEGLISNTKEDIQEFVKKRVAAYKAVKDIVFLKNLPKSSSGKTLRRVLKEL